MSNLGEKSPLLRGSGRGATGSRGSIDSHPLFHLRGPHMVLDPSLFVMFTCAQSVAVVIHSFIHSFIHSVIVVQLTTDNDRSKRSEVGLLRPPDYFNQLTMRKKTG